ncbi:gp53-like domain-containing protein [Plastoroseomonas hellenica]|uniref:gp53-like domain-containing protein n=1 Tax=Plastoroseomonas hellenica TaxID=2687306 RepID=UPI001BAB8F1B|nr:hypothetical protein [Plastoroseomonas hellenica]MBR0643975.1 hypothetical protein [Plastoroseomonas hellenica]
MWGVDHATAVPAMPPMSPAAVEGWFHPGDPINGIARTLIQAELLNRIVAEIRNAVLASGIPLDKSDTSQLGQAIQRIAARPWGGIAGGSANALTLTPTPAMESYGGGSRLSFIAAATNTGAATMNVSGLGVVPLLGADGTPLEAGDIEAGALYDMLFADGAWRMLLAGMGSVFGRTLLDAADAAAAQVLLGGSTIGRAVWSAVNEATGRDAIQAKRRPVVNTVTGSLVLTAAHAGLVVVNAAANMALTLPPAALGPDVGFTFIRVDNTAFTVNVLRAGEDLIEGGTTFAIGRGERQTLLPDGAARWFSTASGPFTASIGDSGYQRLPSGLIIQWGVTEIGDPIPNGIRTDFYGTFPIAFPIACRKVIAQPWSPDGIAWSQGIAVVNSRWTQTQVIVQIQEWMPVTQNLGAVYIALGH